MFQPVIKPETFKTLSDKQIVIACVKKAVESLNVLPDTKDTSDAYKRLMWGSVKRSRVEGVNSIQSLLRFIDELDEPTMVVTRPGTNSPLIKFEVPPAYKAVTAVVRLKDLDLKTRGRKYAMDISPCVVREKTNNIITWEHRFHAPEIRPIRTDAVTFILTAGWDSLVEWFAGEDTSLWEPSGNLGSHWVHLGVDLVEENIRKTRKPYGYTRPFVQPPRAFIPTAPPVPEAKTELIFA